MNDLRLLLRRQLSAAWHYRWQACLFTWLVCALGWGAVFLIPNQYESSARIYIDTDAILTPLLKGIAVDTSSMSQLDVLQRTLLSRPNLEKLISKTNLELQLRTPAGREQMVDRLASQIRISPQTRTLFTITYRNTDPQLAYDVVRTMLAMFVENKTGNNRADIENARKFLNDQIDLYEKQLRAAERRRADFRARYVDLLPPDGGGVNKLDQQNQTVRTLQGQLQDALARRETLSKELGNTQPMVVTETDAATSGGGSSRLREAERTLAELRLRYTEQYPNVIAQRRLVENLRSGGGGRDLDAPVSPKTGGRSRSAPNPIYEQLKVRVVENDASIASLERQIADAVKERDRLNDIARGAPGLQAEYVNLNRDYDVVRRNYEDLLARREAMRISTAADAEGEKVKMQVIDPPTVPHVPVAPKRILLVTGVLAAGFAAGAGLAILMVQMDQSFRSVNDLGDLGFQVVGGVSMLAIAVPVGRRIVPIALFCCALSIPTLVYGGLIIRLSRPGGMI